MEEMKVKRTSMMVCAAALLLGPASFADVNLLDKDDWKVDMYGFLENDVIRDSTRSFTEVVGNSPVKWGGTIDGDNGRTQFSVRNSRLGFKVAAPSSDNGWRARGLLEMDFFGFDPNASTNLISSAPPTNDTTVPNSESSFYSNAVPRIRHAYASLESENWKLLFGQTWSLFGWQPTFVPTTVAVAPLPGNLYQRLAQILAVNTMKWSGSTFQSGLSLERPSQRDSQMPNIALGAKYSLDGWKAGYATPYGEEKTVSATFALSGIFKQFQAQAQGTSTTNQSVVNSSAFAADLLIPILAASDDDTSNSLTLTAEFATGTGIGDQYSGWTGGLNQLPQGKASASSVTTTNLDAGQGYFDGNGNFGLVQLQSYLLNLQYHFPKSWGSFAGIGYGQLSSTSIDSTLNSSANNSFGSLYNTQSVYYVSYFQNLAKQMRAGLEWQHITTQYVDPAKGMPSDDRIQFTTWITI
jgi:hypothetical protein